ncbi:sulfatase-like hydrolase/transferase [Halobacterium sp. GSL-19]|uniref:sulfatase-like hydrolase/transferase n=1 Tax=Halobacterium sp. GSL-19 TaxID=2812551 RepID=UPI001963358E|nr:sulfatase-like hydrolase/transferase [Halobacterium sp. GSL-19]QRY23495.1 sulfatase-like hydrolase/transferase [Halobacterium sp. GSL-19]
MRTNVREWLAEMRQRFRENPVRAPLYVVYTWYLVIWYAVTSRMSLGTNVYERDWDVLLILDACRIDTLREVADEYEFIDDVETMWSVGSQSDEWMANTFTEEYRPEIEKTHYVTGNGHASQLFERHNLPPKNNTTPLDVSRWNLEDLSTFDAVDMVWQDHHDETYGVALPRSMTDHAIQASRDNNPDRLMVHYMQPHRPYIGHAIREGRPPTELEQEGYEQLEAGEADRDVVYDMYRETLRFVLDDIEELLENLDAETVAITADHGESFGACGAYGHPEGFPYPIVKKVPWVETTATDEHSREPDVESSQTDQIDVEEHLEDLGYR